MLIKLFLKKSNFSLIQKHILFFVITLVKKLRKNLGTKSCLKIEHDPINTIKSIVGSFEVTLSFRKIS